MNPRKSIKTPRLMIQGIIKQVIALVIIYLHIRNWYGVIFIFILGNPFINVIDSPWDDTSILILKVITSHSKSLTTSWLTIRKNSTIVSLKSLLNYWQGDCIKYLFLSHILFKYFSKCKLIICPSIINQSFSWSNISKI